MRFAQIYEGKIIYIEQAENIDALKSKYSPSTNWIDITNIECGLGWTVTHNKECEIEFAPPAKPKPPTLDELKSSRLAEAYLLFRQKRDSVVWVNTSIGRLGFDTANEDITNFMAARLDASERGETEYKVWLTDSTKGMVTLPFDDFKIAFNEARKQQYDAYHWFENKRAEIARVNTIEELNIINLPR